MMFVTYKKDMTSQMYTLKTWFDKNQVSLNLNKTKCMLFGNFRTSTRINIVVDGINIAKVSENKFLGVTLDENLSWKSHIKHIHSKISLQY